MKALARCNITPGIWIDFSHTLLFGYRRTVRRGLHSATDTQLWERSCVTSNTTVHYMERINGSTRANASGWNNLHESHFKTLFFIFRLGGLPVKLKSVSRINPLNPELNPICYLLALLVHRFLHVSRIMVKSLPLRLLMSYIYIYIYMWH